MVCLRLEPEKSKIITWRTTESCFSGVVAADMFFR